MPSKQSSAAFVTSIAVAIITTTTPNRVGIPAPRTNSPSFAIRKTAPVAVRKRCRGSGGELPLIYDRRVEVKRRPNATPAWMRARRSLRSARKRVQPFSRCRRRRATTPAPARSAGASSASRVAEHSSLAAWLTANIHVASTSSLAARPVRTRRQEDQSDGETRDAPQHLPLILGQQRTPELSSRTNGRVGGEGLSNRPMGEARSFRSGQQRRPRLEAAYLLASRPGRSAVPGKAPGGHR